MIEISNHYLRVEKGIHSLRIVHVSDLHGKKLGQDFDIMIERIKNSKADFIVATGDISDRHIDTIKQARIFLSRLALHLPVYYVLGNHEQTTDSGIIEEYLTKLKEEGIIILRNNKVFISANIILYGLEMPVRYYRDHLHEYDRNAKLTVSDMNNLIGMPDKSCFNILLAHDPQWFEVYSDWGADLVLSGHIHGGVIRIPGIGGLLSPNVSFFPKYCDGLYDFNTSKMIVSRGLKHCWPFSINNKPECVVIDICHS